MPSSFNPPGPSSAPKKIPDIQRDQSQNPQRPIRTDDSRRGDARSPFAVDDVTPGAGDAAGGARGVGSVGNSQKAHR